MLYKNLVTIIVNSNYSILLHVTDLLIIPDINNFMYT